MEPNYFFNYKHSPEDHYEEDFPSRIYSSGSQFLKLIAEYTIRHWENIPHDEDEGKLSGEAFNKGAAITEDQAIEKASLSEDPAGEYAAACFANDLLEEEFLRAADSFPISKDEAEEIVFQQEEKLLALSRKESNERRRLLKRLTKKSHELDLEGEIEDDLPYFSPAEQANPLLILQRRDPSRPNDLEEGVEL